LEEKKQTRLPSSKEVKESFHDAKTLITLGNLAVEHVLENRYKYDPKWFERLCMALGNLKDAVESRTRINIAVPELALLLLHPVEVTRYISRAEIADIEEPTEKEVEAWAWGSDLAKTSKWFVVFMVLGILAILSFAVVTFGLESPGNKMTIIFLSLGSVILAGATLVLGIGLYRHYVLRGYISWKWEGYPDAGVKRRKHFYQKEGWYAYTVGGFFLAVSVALAIIIGKQLLSSVVLDYYVIRQALLASMAIGLCLFAFGAWPIVRSVVFMAESEKRIGKTKYLASPRLLLALLPILTGALSLLINWIFD